MTPANDEPRTIADLIKQLRDELRYLFRREVDLARAEVTESGKQAAINSTFLAIGAGMGLIGLFVLALAVSFALAVLLALFMPMGVAVWLGPLLVAIVLGVLCYVFVRVGLTRLQAQRFLPEQTTQSLQENKQWLQQKVT